MQLQLRSGSVPTPVCRPAGGWGPLSVEDPLTVTVRLWPLFAAMVLTRHLSRHPPSPSPPAYPPWTNRPDAHRAAKPALRTIAHLFSAASPESSCEGSGGDGCRDSTFCNHPKGNGGECVVCPVEEEHCEDYYEAADACVNTCFQGDVDGVLALRWGGGGWSNNCPVGGCCGPNNRFACGCGWKQDPIDRNSDTCKYRCGWYHHNCA